MEGLWPGAQVGQRSTCKGSGQSRLPGTQAHCCQEPSRGEARETPRNAGAHGAHGAPRAGLEHSRPDAREEQGGSSGGLLGEGADGDHVFRKPLLPPGRCQGDKLLTGVGGHGGAAPRLPHRKAPHVLTGGGGGAQRILLVSEKWGGQEGDPRPGRSWVCGLGLWWVQAG